MSDDERVAIMQKYGKVTMGINEYTRSPTCSIYGENGSWSYTGYGVDYDLRDSPYSMSAIDETYLALDQVMWCEANR